MLDFVVHIEDTFTILGTDLRAARVDEDVSPDKTYQVGIRGYGGSGELLTMRGSGRPQHLIELR